jgi:hypothetical protein
LSTDPGLSFALAYSPFYMRADSFAHLRRPDPTVGYEGTLPGLASEKSSTSGDRSGMEQNAETDFGAQKAAYLLDDISLGL